MLQSHPPPTQPTLSLNSSQSCSYLPPPLFYFPLLLIFLSYCPMSCSLLITLLLHPFLHLSVHSNQPLPQPVVKELTVCRMLRQLIKCSCYLNLLYIYIYHHFGPYMLILKQSGGPNPIYLASLLHFGRRFLISPHSGWHVLRSPVEAQKCRPLLSVPLKLAFWFVNWDRAAVLGLFWIKMEKVWFRQGKGGS